MFDHCSAKHPVVREGRQLACCVGVYSPCSGGGDLTLADNTVSQTNRIC